MMELVSERWYRGLTRAVIAMSALFAFGSLLAMFWPTFEPYGKQWGMSYITLVLAGALLLYVVVLYRFLLGRIGRFATTLTLMLIFTLNIVNLTHSTGQLHSWYHLVWITLVLLSGIFGSYATLGMCFLSLLYAVILVTESPYSIKIDPISIYATAAVFVSGIVSYLFWKKRYRGEENSQVAKLAGQLSSNRLQSEVLINSIGDAIVLIGTDGKINLMNPAAAAMTEWPIEEAVGIDASAVIKLCEEDGKPLPKDRDPISHVLSDQTAMEEVLQLLGRNNKPLVVSVMVSPVLLPNKKEFAGAVAVIRDISNKRAEERRRADFISTASHEMRTPVAAIEGYLALALNDKVSQIDIKARGYLEKAHASTQHLGKLFQDLLTSAKAEDGRLVNHPVVVEMSSFLEQLADSLRFAAEKKGLLVDFVIGADNSSGGGHVVKPLYYTQVDADRIREVITNLFDNAVKYTETGRITIGLTGDSEIVQLHVKDTGPGIPANDIPHLFQKFYRVDNSTTRTIGGTGLGLFICRKIVELYKGRIWVESEVGKGSTFYINLPRLSAQRAAELQKFDAAQADAHPLGLPTNDTSSPVK